jgi:hypothetical protein
MATRRELILSTWAAALADMPQVSGRVWRSRVEALKREESPGVVIDWTQDAPSVSTSLPFLDWNLGARVSVVVRDMLPDLIADPIVAEIHRRTIASTALQALVIDVTPGPQTLELIAADSPAGIVTVPFTIHYRTTYGNPET